MSEPTVSRKLAKVRELLRIKLREVISTYSFTKEELDEADRNGLVEDPNTGVVEPAGASTKTADVMFDDAIGEIYHRQMELRAEDERNLLG